MGGMFELLDGGHWGGGAVSGEEHEFQKGAELDGSAMAGALGILTGLQAEVEIQDDQVGDLLGFFIRGVSHCGHDGVGDTQRDGLLSFNRGVFDPIFFEFLGEVLVQSDVSLGVGGLSGVGESFQEVSRCNRPPCLRNQILPNLVHLALGVLGVTDSVLVDLGGLDARDGWILESRVDQQGGGEAGPLLVELLLLRILSSAHLRGLL